MFRLDILQNQWLILSLAGGLAAVLVVVLGYIALWRPRDLPPTSATTPGAATDGPAARARRGFVPWVLTVSIVALLAWAVAYTVMMIFIPPVGW
jgi:hypothetical protein